MEFEFAGTQKVYEYGGGFIYKGVDLMAYQYQWEMPNDEFIRLEMYIGDEQQLFKPYVYNLSVDNKVLTFASGEITNGIWGFALPK